MKLIAQVKLKTTPEQADSLKHTLEVANAAANYVSQRAWETQTLRQYDLHRLLYYDIRQRFDLSAQVAVRVIAKVADAYKLDRKHQRTFAPLGSIAYDARILSWRLSDHTVNLWTIDSRLRLSFLCGERQLALLRSMQGEADLVYRNGEWFIYQTCNAEEPPMGTPDDFLGVDVGIVSVATDSDGESYSGAAIDDNRRRFAHRRRNLQRKGTKSAKRKLRKLSGRQSRFQKNTNHCIAKALVSKAERTGRGIALEDLRGIRGQLRVKKAQRARQTNWSFFDLQAKIEYKARLRGIPVVYVNPAYTSQVCPVCGCVDRKNRLSQSQFLCTGCGYSANADHNAAQNIGFRARAAVNQPMVSTQR